ncbi:HAMP domain-containing protein [Pseudomonas sp. GCM10022186]|uniref:HAMP domain-containing protein n=1 Tax=Pseudomonas sp. GCM10022186 TaxID=3252650 RepID=UPI003622E0EF
MMFLPGIRLLDRLPLRQKFALISLVIFVPVMLVNALLIEERLRYNSSVNNELKGVPLIRNSLDFISTLQALYDMSQAQRTLQGSATATDLNPLREQGISQLNELIPDWDDTASTVRFVELRDELKEILQGVLSQSVTTRQSQLKQALDQAPELLKLAASGSGLTQNSSAHVRNLVDLLIQKGAKVRWVMGQARAIGSEAFLLQRLPGAASDQLDGVSVELASLGNEFQAILENGALPASLGRDLQANIDTLAVTRTMLERKLLFSDVLASPWQDFYSDMSERLQSILTIEQSALAALEQQLEKNLENSQRSMFMQVALTVLSLTLIIYLCRAFYMSLRRTLNSLADTLQRVADGDFTCCHHAEGRDELKDLGQVLNSSIQRVRGLISEVRDAVGQVETQARQVEGIARDALK